MGHAKASFPEIVIFPGEHLEQLATTLESVAGLLPTAGIHVVRPGLPAVDAVAHMVAGAGLRIVDVRGQDGFGAVLDALDGHFGSKPFCWLFAGEVIDRSQASVLSRGGQIAGESLLPWLESPSPLTAPRVRAHGQCVRSPSRSTLAAFRPGASWRAIILRDVRAEFTTWAQVYADVCTLAHMGELDAAYQRAELSWKSADGDDSLRLVRAAVMLAWIQGCTTSTIPACSHWFSLEPVPFVALMYVRIACGAVPFALIDRSVAMLPTYGSVEYRDGLLSERAEVVMATILAVERERQEASLRQQAITRLLQAGQATPNETAIALGLACLRGLAPETVIDSMADGEQDPTFGDCVNVNLEVNYVGRIIAALDARFRGQWWLNHLVERFVITRNLDAAITLDDAGVVGYDHWSMLGAVGWMPADLRGKALVRAVVHGEIDAEAAQAESRALGAAVESQVTALLEQVST